MLNVDWNFSGTAEFVVGALLFLLVGLTLLT